jgi:Ni/Fe-hydrogenase subunit HybB-like protein
VLIYFAVWLTLAYFLNRWSREQDETGDPRIEERLEEISGPGLILYGLTVTFASIDWVMSLEPHWYSTIYGMIFMIVECMTAMAFVIVVGRLLAESEPLASAVSPSNWQDLGNLLLAFVMLWAYLSFSQFLLIWATNLKDEIPWYLTRTQTFWGVLAALLVVFHFATPFLLLLFRGIKSRMKLLARVGAGLLFVSLLDVYWLVMPAFEPAGPRVHLNDLIAPIGIGGIWLAAFLWQLQKRPLVPRVMAMNLERAAEHGD